MRVVMSKGCAILRPFFGSDSVNRVWSDFAQTVSGG